MKLLRLLGAVILAAGVAAPARAQSSVTSADIQRLQDISYEASRDVAQARTRDAALASQLQAELDDARDEVIYLKVKLRRNEPMSRGDYNDVRDRIENIRSRARGDSAGGYTPPAGSRSESVRRRRRRRRPPVVRRIRTRSRSAPSSTFACRLRSHRRPRRSRIASRRRRWSISSTNEGACSCHPAPSCAES